MRRSRIWILTFLVITILGAAGCQSSGGSDESTAAILKEAKHGGVIPEETEDIRTGYYYSQLEEEEKGIYRQLLKGIQEFQEEIELGSGDKDLIDRVYTAVLCDRMEIFWVKNASTYYTTLYDDYAVFEPNYEKTKEEAIDVSAQMEETADAIAGEIDGAQGSPYEKVKAVYEYIINNTQYMDAQDDQNIVSVFQNHQSVCAGYASSVKYILDRLGIPCIYVQGTSLETGIGHAWNIVELDGEYYYVDATYGDPDSADSQGSGDAEGILDDIMLYDYLCPVPGEYEALCKADDDFALPVCQSDAYNYYAMTGDYFTSYDFQQIYEYCTGKMDEGASDMLMKFADQASYEAAGADLFTEGNLDKLSQYYMNVQGISHVEFRYGNVDGLHLIRFIFTAS